MLPSKKDSLEILKNKRILYMVADESACGQYRCVIPATYLCAAGIDAATTHMAWDSGTYIDNGVANDADIIIAQRQLSPQILELLEKYKRAGKIIIYELDDYLHGVHPTSPAYMVYYPGSEALKMVHKFMELSHAVTVSTLELCEMYRPWNREIYHIHNAIDVEMRNWDIPPEGLIKPDGKIVVGWSGGITHQDDLMTLDPVIEETILSIPNAIFGMYSDTSYIQRYQRLMEAGKVLCIPPTEFCNYPQYLSNIDIGLAPLVASKFNYGKSPLKAMEYGMHGIPSVVSNVAPYARYVEHGVDGFLAKNLSEWQQYIKLLATDSNLRAEMGKAAREKVRSNFDMRERVWDWIRVYADIVTKVESGEYTGGGYSPEFDKDFLPRRNDPCPCGSGKKYKKCCCGAWG